MLTIRHSLKREREFERQNTDRQREFYLNTNVIAKIDSDGGYRKKVELIERAIGDERGVILDVGSGTCGEDEYLATRGFKIICTDVNDLALSVSRLRCARFGRSGLGYIACDGQHLPFANNELSVVLFNEALHHLPNPALGVLEASRVLKPGGRVFMFEPYAYNPWRRLSEVRDRFKGTIEKSFSIRGLRRLCERADLRVEKIERTSYVSATKLDRLPAIHRVARVAYYRVTEALPAVFANILLMARKEAPP